MLVVVLFVGRPFLRGNGEQQEALSAREALQAQKEALLDQIRTLDFELETGKMPEEEYQRQRAPLLQEAASVLKELDDLAAEQQGNGATGRLARDVDADIEAAIAAARGTRIETDREGARVAPDNEMEIEAAVRQLRRTASGNGVAAKPRPQEATRSQEAASHKTGGRFCSQCGNPREAGDKFCAYCGAHFA
jgi:hypothetical protein